MKCLLCLKQLPHYVDEFSRIDEEVLGALYAIIPLTVNELNDHQQIV